VSRALGFSESVARTVSIETGMQNSALAVVLARNSFPDPLTGLPGTHEPGPLVRGQFVISPQRRLPCQVQSPRSVTAWWEAVWRGYGANRRSSRRRISLHHLKSRVIRRLSRGMRVGFRALLGCGGDVAPRYSIMADRASAAQPARLRLSQGNDEAFRSNGMALHLLSSSPPAEQQPGRLHPQACSLVGWLEWASVPCRWPCLLSTRFAGWWWTTEISQFSQVLSALACPGWLGRPPGRVAEDGD
jgi:hypothetical protein